MSVETNQMLTPKKINRHSSWFYIEKRMISSKMLYFLYAAASATYEPYVIVFLISLGLDPIQAGLIGGIRVVGSLIGVPLWTFIADAKNSHKFVSFTICVGSLIFMLIQPVISMFLGGRKCRQCADSNAIDMLINASSIGNSTLTAVQTHSEQNMSLFYVMLTLNILLKFFDSAQSGVIDHLVVEKCYGNGKENSDFGRQRVFGAFGFGAGVLISTYAIDLFQHVNINCYMGMALVHALVTICLLATFVHVFKKRTYPTLQIKKAPDNPKVFKLLWKTLANIDVLFFLCTTFVLGTMQSFYMSFNALLLRDINAPNIVNGVSVGVAAVSCVLTYFYGTKIIDKLHGIWNVLILCTFCYSIRFLMVGYLTNPWLMLLIQTSQAVCYGLFIVAGVLHIKEITPSPVRTTMYGIFNTLKFGVSFIVGNVIGGYIYEEHKAKTLFTWASYASMVWTVVLIIFTTTKYLIKKKGFLEKNKSPPVYV